MKIVNFVDETSEVGEEEKQNPKEALRSIEEEGGWQLLFSPFWLSRKGASWKVDVLRSFFLHAMLRLVKPGK